MMMVMAEQSEENRAYSRRLAAESIANGDATGWFETLYAAAEAGRATVPWADRVPNPHVIAALADAPRSGRALVIGCGLGDDAEYMASLGYPTVAFDVSPTAVEAARRRFPESTVDYAVADLLSPPDAWAGAFDLVIEVYTLQVLTGPARETAIEQAARLVAPGGHLLVVARARDEEDDPGAMPWPLTRAEIELFIAYEMKVLSIVDFLDDEDPPKRRWKAWFTK